MNFLVIIETHKTGYKAIIIFVAYITLPLKKCYLILSCDLEELKIFAFSMYYAYELLSGFFVYILQNKSQKKLEVLL